MAARFILAFGISASLIGVLAIAGWVSDLPALTTWIGGSMPMAPLTGVLAAGTGVSLAMCAFRARASRCLSGLALSLPVLGISVAVVALRMFDRYPAIERLGIDIEGTLDGAPIGFVSSMTAGCFALASLAFIAQTVSNPNRQSQLATALGASAVLFVTGFASLLTTWLGFPLLAGPTHIPIAFNTSVVLLLVASALAMMVARLFYRAIDASAPTDRSWQPLAMTFAAVALLTIGTGYAFYRQEEQEIRVELEARLEAISLVKTADAAAAAAAGRSAGLQVRTRLLPDSEWTLLATGNDNVLRAALWERLRWVLALAAMLLLSAGAVLTLIWRTNRIERYRERAALDQVLRLQAIRVSELAARSPAVLYTLRVNGRGFAPADMSPNVERILGYTVAEALDATWFPSHIHPDDFDAAMAAPAALAAQDEMINEFRFIRKDGSVLWISNQMTVTAREAGQPVEVTGAWHDITERRAAESALRESEERLRLALGSAAQGLWDLNIQTDIAVVSPEYATMLGYDPAEFHETNSAWRERLHPDDRDRADTVYRDYVAGRRATYATEFRQRTNSGDWKWILSAGKIISRTADGSPLRMIGTHTDITVRKLAELRSERLAELYEALSTCNFAIAHCTDQTDLFQRVCEAASGIRGVSAVWVGVTNPATQRVERVAAHGSGPAVHALVASDNSDAGRGPTGTAIRENRPCWMLDLPSVEALSPWRALIAQYGWVAAGSFPLRRGGRAIGALTIYATTNDAFDEDSRRLLLEMAGSVSSALDSLDTERRRAANEEALRESHSRYRALFADTDVPRLVLDPCTGRIIDANVAAAVFYGWSLAQLLTMNIADINTLGPEAVRVKLAAAHNGVQRSFEFKHRLANGELRDVQVFATSITFNGESQLLSTIFDVTETKRAAAALQATLQEREALLKEVHHRVKNNLQVISSLLRLERERHADPGVKFAMDEMQLRILSMALLHEALYRSSDLARVDLGAYLADLAGQVFRSAAPAGGVISLRTNLASVLVDIDHAVPCGLLVNEVLANCLKHAFPDGRGGEVSIDLQPVNGGPAYLLRISDTGVGLPADFDARRSSSLGVHLIQVLARQLKASLTIDGGAGTTFSISFAPDPHHEATP